MDRIRAGLTGLGAVFLVTAAASLMFVPSSVEATKKADHKEHNEPLSQLGVAPSIDPARIEEQTPRPPVITPLTREEGQYGSESPVEAPGKPRQTTPVEV